jgi:ubiquitin-conjugating enzyme E2 variant
MPLAALLGILFADFTSGFVHWLFDTWGAVDTPVVGALVIRTFRHHHVDQHAITRHGFVETNGHNFTLSTLASGFGVLCLLGASPVGFGHVFCAMSAVFAAFFVAFTSQIHKWSHEEPDRAPRAIVLLQRAGLVLSPLHHAVHHVAPYNRHYCITVGWMNGPLRAIRFFESLERAITAVTGAIPRADDIGEGAALRVASEADGTPSVTQDPAETRDLA